MFRRPSVSQLPGNDRLHILSCSSAESERDPQPARLRCPYRSANFATSGWNRGNQARPEPSQPLPAPRVPYLPTRLPPIAPPQGLRHPDPAPESRSRACPCCRARPPQESSRPASEPRLYEPRLSQPRLSEQGLSEQNLTRGLRRRLRKVGSCLREIQRQNQKSHDPGHRATPFCLAAVCLQPTRATTNNIAIGSVL